MNEILEIVFLGRGGQGGKTATEILAEAYLNSGCFVQAFSEYGPERSGAPVKSFLRVSNSIIQFHNEIENPNFIVILDDTLLSLGLISDYLHKNITFLVNSNHNIHFLLQKYNYLRKTCVYAINADKIALDILSKPFSNVVMMGFLIYFDKFKSKKVLSQFKPLLIKKFGEKEGDKNFSAVNSGFVQAKNNID